MRSTSSKVAVPVLGLCLISGLQVVHGQADKVADAKQPQLWNQWRGPARTGQFQGRAWPRRMTKKNVKQLWRVELGPSYSGPIVDAKHVFTTETVSKSHEVVRAFDRKTGKPAWQKKWKGAMNVPFFARRNGSWIRSTPAHDGESIYVAGMRDVLYCLDIATGKERWKVDFMERFGSQLPQFGFVCSPLLHGEHVYVQAAGGLVKLDKKTGKTVWRGLVDGGGMFGSAFSSPVVANVKGIEQLLVQTRNKLCGVEMDGGKALWQIPVKTFRGMNILTPLLHKGDSVFVVGVRRARVTYFDVAANGRRLRSRRGALEQSRAGLHDELRSRSTDYAYLYLRSKRFACVELESGKVAWISEPIGDEYWSLVAQKDRILALSEGGELRLIQANPEKLEVIDTMEVAKSETWAHLAVDGDQIVIRELDALTAFQWKKRVRVARSGDER